MQELLIFIQHTSRAQHTGASGEAREKERQRRVENRMGEKKRAE